MKRSEAGLRSPRRRDERSGVEWSGGADANLGVAEGNGGKVCSCRRTGEVGRRQRQQERIPVSRRWVALETSTSCFSLKEKDVTFKKNEKDATPSSPLPFSGKRQKKVPVGECISCHLPALKSLNTLRFEALLRFDFFPRILLQPNHPVSLR